MNIEAADSVHAFKLFEPVERDLARASHEL